MSPSPIRGVNGLLLTIALAAFPAACASTHTAGNTTQHETQRSTTMNPKQTVGAFLGAAIKNDTATMRQLANADYIQHNPYVPTGLEPFIGMLPVLQAAGTTAENVRMFQDGNYVFMHNIWRNAQPFGAEEMVAFDIIRVDDNGKVAEHWDAMTPLVKQTASGRTQTDGPVTSTDAGATEANKAAVVALFKAVVSGDQARVGAAVTATFDPDYVNHSPGVGNGIPALFEAFGREQWVYTTNHKVLGEGNFVLSISEGTVKGVPSAFYDLLRFENGKAVEHWDVIQPVPSEGLANTNGMFGF